MFNKPNQCNGCPLRDTGRGWVCDSGDPKTAKYGLVLEAPGSQEISFQLRPQAGRGFYETQAECDAELARRREAFPDIEDSFLKLGAPIVGPTGQALVWMILNKVGIKREECFIQNVIRCLPPKSKNGGQYPTGAARKQAEAHCRVYDRVEQFSPDTLITTIHPSSLLREITPLPLVVKDFEKMRDFTAQGRRVMMLIGGKAAHAFLRYAENVTRWRGHYSLLASDWSSWYKNLFVVGSKGKASKGPRLTKQEKSERDFFGVPLVTIKKARAKAQAKARKKRVKEKVSEV